MSFLTDVVPFSMPDNERGKTINRNLSFLTAQLEIAGGTIALKDGDADDLFGANDIIIGPEDILVGSGNAITRAQNGTPDSLHKNEAMVRLKGGTLVVSLEFTGSVAMTGIRAGGNVPGMFQMKFNSDWGPMLWSGGFGQEVFFPFSGYQPLITDIAHIYVWTNSISGVFSAWYHR